MFVGGTLLPSANTCHHIQISGNARVLLGVVDHSHSGKADVWLHHPALVGLLPWRIASWYVYFSSISSAWLWWRVAVVVDSSQAVGVVGLLLLRGNDGVFCPVL